LLPRIDRRKKVQVITRKAGVEVVCATIFGKDGSFECPGGANGQKAFVRRWIPNQRNSWERSNKSFENWFKRNFGEPIGVRNIGSMAQRRTTIGK
jgi:hypothetical protein